MQGIGDIITKEDIEKYAGGKIDLGRTVESFISHNGWKLLMAIFLSQERKIKDKADYKSLEEFKADRKALEIVQDMIDELNSSIDDSKEAIIQLNKLNQAESQTPDLLSVDGEGIDEE